MIATSGLSRRAVLRALSSTAAFAATGVGAVPVLGALGRPALAVRHGEDAVLLGAALAGRRIVAVGERGLAMISDDDGAGWRQAIVPVSVTLTTVRFADETHGVAVGHEGVVLTTTDGGQAWKLALDGRRAADVAVAVARGDTARAAAERLVSDGPDKPFLDVATIGPRTQVAVGAYGLAFASTDGGESWSSWMDRLDNPKGLHYCALKCRGATLVIVGEQGLLLRSDDGGESFRRLESPYKGSFFTVELPGDQDMVVGGLRGNAWRSRDAGRTWTRLEAPMPATLTASLLLPDGGLLMANQAGFVLRLVQERLVPVNRQPLPPINALIRTTDHLVALTMQGARVLSGAPFAIG